MKLQLLFALIGLLLLFISCKETNEQLLDEGYKLSKQDKHNEAIQVFSDVIKKNNKIQLAYYNRGHCYFKLKNYRSALWDFNKVMELHMIGNFVFTANQDSPFADEEGKTQVPYYDALYQRGQVKFEMDSLKSAFEDFTMLINNNYEEKSNCILWLGIIWIKGGKAEKACDYFNKAKHAALNDEDKKEADKMLQEYCQPPLERLKTKMKEIKK